MAICLGCEGTSWDGEGVTMSDPLIAVIGSVQPSRATDIRLKDPVEGEKAAEIIGRALAKRKCRLVAYSAAELSVEHLGSGLIDQSQKATAAAMQIADK
jgi:hypothetical protein